MRVTLIYYPEERELKLFKQAMAVTRGKIDLDPALPNSAGLTKMLRARHSPIRVLNFAYLIEGIPSNTATHLCRHVHAQPFVSSLRNDLQDKIDGDKAPRDTPVDMIFYCNAEELMCVANKRLCAKAAARTREVVRMMCVETVKAFPEIDPYLVPACVWHGNTCHEINGCGRWD